MKKNKKLMLSGILIFLTACSSAVTEEKESETFDNLAGRWSFTTGKKDSIETEGKKLVFEYLTEGELIFNPSDDSYEIITHTSIIQPEYIQHAIEGNYHGKWKLTSNKIAFDSKGGDEMQRKSAIAGITPTEIKFKLYNGQFDEEILELSSEKMVTADTEGIKTYYRKINK